MHLSKFVDDPELLGMVNMLEGRAAIQRDLGQLKKWADGNFRKWEVLLLGWNNPRLQQCRLGGGKCLGSSSAEKDSHRSWWTTAVNSVLLQPRRPTISWTVLVRPWPVGRGK